MLRFMLHVILIWEISNANVFGNVGKYVIVETGVVRGHAANDGVGDYFAFLGIPYAAPPIGTNRFKDPRPPNPWKGVFEANRTVVCPQIGIGDEDCLIANVFTPTTSSNNVYPVLVYIHGGSFLMGCGQTKGVAPLIKENLIVVTINYRLGALGFLCLGIEGAPGNAGLKDQLAALRWVQRNIRNFGGDPSQVTIYGMSAGGASVELQVLSKNNQGLFQKAIVESASAIPVWTIDSDPIDTALTLARKLGFSRSRNVFKLLKFYQEVSAEDLSRVNYEYYDSLIGGTFGCTPCVERNLHGTENMIVEPPIDTLRHGNYVGVPMMFSYATLEGLFLRSTEYYEQNYKERMEANFVDFMPADLIFDTDEIKRDVSKNIKRFYFGNKTIGNDTIIEYLNYFGDYLVLHGLLNSVQMHSRNGYPVFLMEFAYKGELGSYDEFYDYINVAGHGDVIKHAILNKPIRGKNDELAVDRVAKLIANFVKFGNPVPTPSHLLPVPWPRVEPLRVSSLLFDQDMTVQVSPHWRRKVFWDVLYSKYRRPIKPVDPESMEL